MIETTIKTEGFGEIREKLKALRDEFSSRVNGVELRAVARKDAKDPSNADLIQYLAEGGRDFYGKDDMNSADVEKIAQAFVSELETQLEKREMGVSAHVVQTASEARRNAEAASGAALRAAMKAYMRVVTDNIEGRRAASGGALKKPNLSPNYIDEKISEFGFDYPIGVASGQLLSNLNPEAASRNIQLVKSKK